MSKYFITITLLLLTCTLAANDDIRIIKERLQIEYLKNIVGSADFVDHQLPDGQWADIDYSNRRPTEWPVLEHLSRLQAMTKAFYGLQAKDSLLAHRLVQGIGSGLRYWCTKAPKSDNWWYNEIGQQKELAPILVLMQAHLSPQTVQQGANYFVVGQHQPLENINRVWEYSNCLVRAVLEQNASALTAAIANVQEVLALKKQGEEGIQSDNAYLVHGPQLYNGGYGYSLIDEISFWMCITRQTEFQFSKAALLSMRAFVLDGFKWMLWKGKYDFSVIGREISRSDFHNGRDFPQIMRRLMLLDPIYAKEYKKMIGTGGTSPVTLFSSNKMFYTADYMVLMTDRFHFSVKMCSSRTVGTESLNGENSQGYWLPFGANCLMRSGLEYDSIFPLWDWTLVPGITAPKALYPFVYQTQKSDFVGGVSNGKSGVAVMELADKSSTSAKKSWFLFEDEIIALGSGVSSRQTAELSSSIEQCRLKGPVWVNGQAIPCSKDTLLEKVRTLYHDSVAYFFPFSTPLSLSTTVRSGSWSEIGASKSSQLHSDPLFSLRIPHGIEPKDAIYSYVIKPAVSREETALFLKKNSVQIIRNDTAMQAVRDGEKQLTGIVFYKAGELVFQEQYKLQSNQPCVLLINMQNNTFEISVADPTQKLKNILLTLYKKNLLYKVLDIDFPKGDRHGASVVVHFE